MVDGTKPNKITLRFFFSRGAGELARNELEAQKMLHFWPDFCPRLGMHDRPTPRHSQPLRDPTVAPRVGRNFACRGCVTAWRGRTSEVWAPLRPPSRNHGKQPSQEDLPGWFDGSPGWRKLFAISFLGVLKKFPECLSAPAPVPQASSVLIWKEVWHSVLPVPSYPFALPNYFAHFGLFFYM